MPAATVVFLVITLSPSRNPLVISVSVSVCNPIVTGIRLRVVLVVLTAEEVALSRTRVEDADLFLNPVLDTVLEAILTLSVEVALENLRDVDDTSVPGSVLSCST